MMRVEGIRTSQERVRRFMREHDLQAPPRAGHAHGPKAHDGTIKGTDTIRAEIHAKGRAS